MDIWEQSVAGLLSGYARREFSPTEVVDGLLARIDELDGSVGAFRQVLAGAGRARAARATAEIAAGEEVGPLCGIPVAIKELIDVEGAAGCYGSLVMRGRVGGADAEVVRRLRRAGAIVIGVTRSHEFGWGITTQHALLGGTRNPWGLDRVPGGSSGGSAAALAGGMVPLALGTDTGGSIRIPASFCGVVGLKPAFGRISRTGVVPLATSLDHVGLLARTVQDVARVLPLLVGYDPQDPATRLGPLPPMPQPTDTGDLGGLRVAVAPGLHFPRPAPDHEQVFVRVLAAAEASRARMVEADAGDPDRIREVFATIQMAEAYHTHSVLLATYPSQAAEYGPDVRRRLESAAGVTISDYLTARTEALRIRERFRAVFEAADVLIIPVAAGPPSLIASPDTVEHLGRPLPFRDLVMGYTVPQDLTGLPACVIPAGLDQAGLPVGVQITGPPDREDLPIRVGMVLERVLGVLGPPPDRRSTG